MRATLYLLVILNLVNQCISQDPGSNDIASLPGFESGPKVYAGILNIKNNATLHYVLVEAKTNNDTVTLWMGGEPGCSSKLGFLTEIGPFLLKPGTSVLTSNNYSWHGLSHLLFIDSPQGVGYSLNGSIPFLYNDQNTAEDNLYGLLAFYERFPSFKTKSLFIAGESYAGKFIPDLALRINSYNLNAETKINLKGILVGNGVMDFSDNMLEKSQVNYMFSHNFIDPTLDKYWEIACQADPSSAGCAFFFRRYDDILAKVNFHNIYGTCYTEPNSTETKFLHTLTGYQNKKMNYYNTIKKCQTWKALDEYIKSNGPGFNTQVGTFITCNDTIYNRYDRNLAGSMNEYARLIVEASGIRIHFYAGDWDDIVPFDSTLSNLEKLGLRQNTFTHWTNSITKQHIGFKREFFYAVNKKIVKFWIVKGAGHEVPQHKPDVAY